MTGTLGGHNCRWSSHSVNLDRHLGSTPLDLWWEHGIHPHLIIAQHSTKTVKFSVLGTNAAPKLQPNLQWCSMDITILSLIYYFLFFLVQYMWCKSSICILYTDPAYTNFLVCIQAFDKHIFDHVSGTTQNDEIFIPSPKRQWGVCGGSAL